MKKIFTQLLLMSITLAGQAQDFVTDSLFGNNGQNYADLLSDYGRSANIIIQPDDKILLTGYVFDFNNNAYFNTMFRTDACGQIDSSFGTDGLVKHNFQRVNIGEDYLLQPDGKIIVIGTQAQFISQPTSRYPFIARYNSDGSVDSTFGTNGTTKFTASGNARIESVYRLSNGKFLCTNALFMVQFDSTGIVDPSFYGGSQFIAMPPFYNDISRSTSRMRSDGKILTVAAGYYTPFSTDNLVMMCYDTNGILDSTFGTMGFQMDETFDMDWENAPLMALQSDDKVIAAMKNLNGDTIKVGRYNTNGSLDATFGTDGYLRIPISPTSFKLTLGLLTLLNDDSFIIGVTNQDLATGDINEIYKYSSDGILDPTFSINGGNLIQLNSPMVGQADIGYITPDGEMILGTSSPESGNSGIMALTKFTTTPSNPNITQTGNILNSNVANPNSTFEWLLNGNVISGETASTLTTTVDGTYSVIVTNATGCTATADFVVMNTGINNQTTNSTSINVYPNPANNTIHISWSGTDNSTIELIDLTGRVVMMQSGDLKNQAEMNIQHLAKGVYLIKVSSNTFSNITRVTID